MSFLDPLLLDNFVLSRDASRSFLTYTVGVVLVLASVYLVPSFTPVVHQFLKFINFLPATAGCSRVGFVPPDSNLLHDEYESRHVAGDADGNGKSWKIKSMWIYPIKSCAGVELSRSPVVKTGLAHDRQFSFARLRTPLNRLEEPSAEKLEPRWEFITIREYPLMANIHTELWLPDQSLVGYASDLPAVRTGGVIRVKFPYKRAGLSGVMDMIKNWYYGDELGMTSFTVPYQPTAESVGSYPIETMRIWKDFPAALNFAQHVPTEELKAYLGCQLPLTLFRSHVPREVYRDAPRKEQLGWQPVAAFNDAYPINLLGLSSVRDLDDMQPSEADGISRPPRLSARRFRANIILEGTPAYEEEKWKYIKMGDFEYFVAARCVRCKIPNVDPDSGVRHKAEPDRTIRKERRVDKGAPGGTGCMAIQLVPKLEYGSISVGDVIEVMEEGEHVYTPM